MRFPTSFWPLRSIGGSPPRRRLVLEDHYTCPVCRHGQLRSMVMMDAFSCEFCRQLFTANLEQQIIRLEGGLQPMGWRWLGHRWQPLHQRNSDITVLVWLASFVFLLIPAELIWLCAYIFPPLEGLTWRSFPMLWGDVTFGLHCLIAAWLLVEHYQLPAYVACKTGLQRLRDRWQQREN
ncbi:hypothetical protein [Alkalinema sp. FACHB-956]|uniref:hypothetical protein n=1 Tax=Alkalinema sp. FACHB-956 TaxID=2692768 RepID=UPI00168A13BE|nr:hypothetical protein [Alkalinema sp. FACHB-956]MBD2326313.1 hypothetical protein [Alkalinema sp. FACHB-956]